MEDVRANMHLTDGFQISPSQSIIYYNMFLSIPKEEACLVNLKLETGCQRKAVWAKRPGFEMPPDPRIYRGPRGETPRDFYGSFYTPPEKQYVEDGSMIPNECKRLVDFCGTDVYGIVLMFQSYNIIHHSQEPVSQRSKTWWKHVRPQQHARICPFHTTEFQADQFVQSRVEIKLGNGVNGDMARYMPSQS